MVVKCNGELAPENKTRKGREMGVRKPRVKQRGALATRGL